MLRAAKEPEEPGGVHPWSSLANCRLLYLELPPYLKSLGYLHMVCYNELTCYFGEGRVENTICSNDSQRTYTAEQVARILGVSVRTAYYLCERTTEFKVIRLGKRCLRVHKESFDRWLDGQTSVS